MRIDLNADLGEGGSDDAAILACVSSVNIACGWHAGDSHSQRQAIRAAMAHGVSIGAHPSYPDRANFGRTAMVRAPELVFDDVLYQVGGLAAMVRAAGGRLCHVKPHGALYNQAAADGALADAIAAAVRAFDPHLQLVGLAGSELIHAARRHGLQPVEEVFADRAYLASGALAPRQQPGAVLDSVAAALAQAMGLVQEGHVTTLEGTRLALRADTVCLHGDGAHALQLASALRRALSNSGVVVSAMSSISPSSPARDEANS
ncbi:5-oxoprolinase subunit PxpA [Aeromonas cavernicola]|uniref:5-oxoprolinase subunit A n=1 Tax=Aeromonas cavernicola TaxID=1006623 RepID=A0A2H9U299_9GAMM|nr:5-oxoprolinase subunit PxpA [Aeromonas cavernicola]PJG58187.1 hypothetical protein CUC53_14275 [Aeromonas cavernicola]